MFQVLFNIICYFYPIMYYEIIQLLKYITTLQSRRQEIPYLLAHAGITAMAQKEKLL